MLKHWYRSVIVVAAVAAVFSAGCSRADAADTLPVEHYVRKLGLSFPNGKVPDRALRIALAGSSITWGNGYLDSSYPAYVDDYLRTGLADTVRHDAMIVTGDSRVVKNPKLYGGTAVALAGDGAACEFELEGNEVSVCFAIEREAALAANPKTPQTATYRWQWKTPRERQVEGLVLTAESLVAAGRIKDTDAAKVRGFLALLSRETGVVQAELGLPSPPVLHGVCVVSGKTIVCLENGSVVCLGAP